MTEKFCNFHTVSNQPGTFLRLWGSWSLCLLEKASFFKLILEILLVEICKNVTFRAFKDTTFGTFARLFPQFLGTFCFQNFHWSSFWLNLDIFDMIFGTESQKNEMTIENSPLQTFDEYRVSTTIFLSNTFQSGWIRLHLFLLEIEWPRT